MDAFNDKCVNTWNEDADDKRMTHIDPPDISKSAVKKPIKLVIQIINFLIIVFPLIILRSIQNIFFTKTKSVKGKVVLVTGSGRGLGQGFVEKFAELGCKVACVDIDEELNTKTVMAINKKYPNCAKSYKCNVATSEDIKKLREAVNRDFGYVNILINNAGLLFSAPIMEFEDQFLNAVLSVNLASHFLLIREFLPDMTKYNDGHIVAISSIAGLQGISKGSIYAATKHGIIGLMDSLHQELKEIPNNKVRTSVVCPYFVNTSAHYSKLWDIRIPPLSIQETIDAAVDGILKNKTIIIIPSIHIFLLIMKMLPETLSDILRNIFYVKVSVPSKKFQQATPVYRLLLKQNENMVRV